MSAVPLWMLGRHLTAVQATLQTVDPTAGTLANAASSVGLENLVTTTGFTTFNPPTIVTTVGLVDSISLNADKTSEDISAVTSPRSHWVPIALNYRLTVTEILRQAANSCLLADLWHATDAAQNLSRVVLFVFARAGNRWQGYFLLESYEERLVRGKTTGVMTLVMVDPGTPNLVYSANDR